MHFWFYLNVLPIMEKVLIYLLFLLGAILLVCSIVKILSYQAKESPTDWLETEMERRRQRAKNDKLTDWKEKEMDAYNSFLTPDDEI
jgi:predicted Holliday junction resolvase-like endonuclease